MAESTPRVGRKVSGILELCGVALILGVGAYLRFARLTATPGYYSDEGTLLDIAHHLLQGKWQYLALNRSTLLVARMPLFPLLLAAASKIMGEGIATLRTITASLGVASILGTYALSRQLGGRTLGVIAAAVLAIHPLAVVYSRLGFSYNLLAVLALLVGILILRFLDRGALKLMFTAGLLIGIGTISDLLMAVYLIPVGLIGTSRGRKAMLACLLGAALPLALYATYMWLTAGSAFMFDLRFTLGRLSAIPLYGQFPVATLNYARLLQLDPWFVPAMFGIFAMRTNRNRWFMLLMFLLPLLLIARSVTGLAGLGYYYLIAVLPFATIGIAQLVIVGTPLVLQSFRGGIDRLFARWGWSPSAWQSRWLTARAVTLIVSLALFILVLSPFLISGMTTVIGIQRTLSTPIDFLLVDSVDARQAAEFVNSRTDSSDLVVASPALVWLLDAQASDFQLSLAAAGQETLHFPQDLPSDRLEYDPTLSRASFVIVDGIWRNWAEPVMPAVSDLLEEVEGWPLVFELNGVRVYGNPRNVRSDQLPERRLEDETYSPSPILVRADTCVDSVFREQREHLSKVSSPANPSHDQPCAAGMGRCEAARG